MLGVLILAVWSLYPLWMEHIFTPKNTEMQSNLGTLGDSFGALNTLFSGFAFAGIIVSIYLQSNELKETRKEIKAQGDQFELQTRALNKQNFENTFFQLLSLYNEILNSISVYKGHRENREKIFGRDAIQDLYANKFLEKEYIHFLERIARNDDAFVGKHVEYMGFHRCYEQSIGHYFRNIYQILKFVDESDVADKKFYTNLLRAQLSSSELSLLFYNCLSEVGFEKFKPLVEKYEFFEHLPPLTDMDGREILMYKKEAFGKTNHNYLSEFGELQFETE